MIKFSKFLISTLLVFILTNSVCSSKTIKGGVDLNWPLLDQEERTKIINHYRGILFDDVKREIDMEQFKSYKKDPDSRENRGLLKNDIKKLDDKELAGFYLFGKILIIYGIKYKEDKYHVYYYNALGHLAYVDVLNKPHDEFPHIAYQYDNDGELKGISYYISDYDQYVFEEDGDFKGRWYYSKLYDKKAKIIMTRKLP